MKLVALSALVIANAVELRGSSRLGLGSQVICPSSPGSVPMAAGDWCVLNCSTAVSFDIDFGQGKFAPNAGNVEFVDEANFKDFLDGYPFFHYQAGSQIAVNKAKAENQILAGPLVIIQCANQQHGAQPAQPCGTVQFQNFKCVASCGGVACDPSAGTCCRDNQCYGGCVAGTCCEVVQTGAVVGCCTQGGDCCGSISAPTCCGAGASCCHSGAAAGGCCPPNAYCCTTSATGCCLREGEENNGSSDPDAVSGTPRLGIGSTTSTPSFMAVNVKVATA